MASPTAAAATPTPVLSADPNSMTIPQLKQALMEAGHEADVWALANNKKSKKADWVALARAKMGG